MPKIKHIAAIAASIMLTSTPALAQVSDTPGASCEYNKTTPIIPDGNIATKDELIAAQKRIKAYQEGLLDFRECLVDAEKTLDPEAEDFESVKAALVARSNESIDLEQSVANEFNNAIKIYNDR